MSELRKNLEEIVCAQNAKQSNFGHLKLARKSNRYELA